MSHAATTYPQGASWRNLGHIDLVALAALVSMVLSTPTAIAAAKKVEQAFVGSWRLQSFERVSEAGKSLIRSGNIRLDS
jgi:ABC-type proline/glycine betaine transport system permease subunit